MQRTAAVLFVSALAMTLALAGTARAEGRLLSVELSGGVGVSAYNTGSDSALAPPFIQAEAALLFIEAGPFWTGPALSIPLGFYEPEGEDLAAQLAIRPGWALYHRPSVDFAWSAVVGPSFVVTKPFVWGLEVEGSVAYFLLAGFALTAGLQYGFFYGVDPVHVISGRLGLLITWEVGR